MPSEIATLVRPGAPGEPLSQSAFRGIALLFALLLLIFCFWVLLADLSLPGTEGLPVDRDGAERAVESRNDARWGAVVGIIRGELWARSAFTYADLMWADSDEGRDRSSEQNSAVDEARRALGLAVRYEPVNSAVWLFAADLGLHFGRSHADPAAALRMSYYTGPNELTLMPLRAQVAAGMATLDADLQQLAKRDLRLLLAHHQRPAIQRAYRAGTPSGKQLIEAGVRETDPAYAETLRRGIKGVN
jgi:hypothetical protein